MILPLEVFRISDASLAGGTFAVCSPLIILSESTKAHSQWTKEARNVLLEHKYISMTVYCYLLSKLCSDAQLDDGRFPSLPWPLLLLKLSAAYAQSRPAKRWSGEVNFHGLYSAAPATWRPLVLG